MASSVRKLIGIVGAELYKNYNPGVQFVVLQQLENQFLGDDN